MRGWTAYQVFLLDKDAAADDGDSNCLRHGGKMERWEMDGI